MKFDSKSYLYGECCRVFRSAMSSDDCGFKLIDKLLGDYKIEPGEIKSRIGKELFDREISFVPVILDTPITMQCGEFNFDCYSNYSLNVSTSNSKISISNMHNGLIYYIIGESGYYSEEYGGELYYYDYKTVDCLRKKYNLKLEEIAGLKASKLKSLGFDPDKIIKLDMEKVKEHGGMAYFLLHEYKDNIEDFKNKLCEPEMTK